MASDPKLKSRRLFQFRLRTFMLIVLVFAPFVTWLANSYHQHQRELETLAQVTMQDATPFKIIKNGEPEIVITE